MNESKDHWSTGSVIFIGENINGNRMVGESNDQLKPRKIDPATLEIDEENGIEITIQHIHRALRNHLGFEGNPLNSKYPMPVESIALFGQCAK